MMSYWDRLDGWAKRNGIDKHAKSHFQDTMQSIEEMTKNNLKNNTEKTQVNIKNLKNKC